MIYKKVASILAELLSIEEEDISLEMPLVKDEALKPIDVAKLVIECEKAFKIEIYDEYVHEFLYVKNLVSFIDSQINEGFERTFEANDDNRTDWYY